MEEWTALMEQGKLKSEKTKELEIFIEKLKKSFQKEPSAKPAITKNKKPAEKKLQPAPESKIEFNLDLYIVDSDVDFLSLIEKEGRERQLRIKIQQDSQEALKDIQGDKIKPRMLIAGTCISQKHKTAKIKEPVLDSCHLIEEYRKKRPALSIPVQLRFTEIF